MKQIKLSDTHYIVVDDSEIKEGDWYYDSTDKEGLLPIYQKSQDLIEEYFGCLKITHSTEPLVNPKCCIAKEGITNMNKGCSERNRCLEVPIIPLSEVEELVYGHSVEMRAHNLISCSDNIDVQLVKAVWKEGFKAHQELYPYSRNEVHKLMCKAFENGYKKHDIIEAGLESLGTDIECAWILTKFDSTPKITEWDVEFDEQGKIKLI